MKVIIIKEVMTCDVLPVAMFFYLFHGARFILGDLDVFALGCILYATCCNTFL